MEKEDKGLIILFISVMLLYIVFNLPFIALLVLSIIGMFFIYKDKDKK